MSRKIVFSVVLIVALISGGSAAGWLLLITRDTAPRTPRAAAPLVVETVPVRRGNAVERFTGYGSVAADRTSELRAEVAAVVVERVGDLEAGAVVRAGDALVRLDPRQYEHELERAVAEVGAASARLEQLDVSAANLEPLISIARKEVRINEDEVTRLRGLMESDRAVKKELDFAKLAYERSLRVLQGFRNDLALIEPARAQARANVRAGEAGTDLARLNIERCLIRAPFDGAVSAVAVEIGERVNVGSPLVTVVDAARVEIPIRLPVSVRSRVRVGAACRIDIESGVGTIWEGTVARLDPTADLDTRTFAAYVEVDNTVTARPLMPGTFVRGRIRGQPQANALTVPRAALHDGHVFVVRDGTVRAIAVELDRVAGDVAVVRGDLTEGERVVHAGLDRLKDGMKVRADAAGNGTGPGPDVAAFDAGGAP